MKFVRTQKLLSMVLHQTLIGCVPTKKIIKAEHVKKYSYY